MRFEFKVQCTHPHPGIGKNVDCEFIEQLENEAGAVFRCPQCNREIVVKLGILEEQA